MKTCIWDLDGTLIDSYPEIEYNLIKTLKEEIPDLDEEDMRKRIIESSVTKYLKEISQQYCLEYQSIHETFDMYHESGDYPVQLMPGVKEILLLDHIQHMVITHRGKSTYSYLEHTGIRYFFREVITSQDHFPRKPDPSSLLHLIEKYDLNPEDVYYIGDRNLDMEFAVNAGVYGILYIPENSHCISNHDEDFCIHEMEEIRDIVSSNIE